MKKRIATILLIWNIIMTPSIITVFNLDLSSTLLRLPVINIFMNLCNWLNLMLQGIFLPQIISISLVLLYLIVLYRNRIQFSPKKDIPKSIILILWCVLGAVCSLVFFLMLCEGFGEQIP